MAARPYRNPRIIHAHCGEKKQPDTAASEEPRQIQICNTRHVNQHQAQGGSIKKWNFSGKNDQQRCQIGKGYRLLSASKACFSGLRLTVGKYPTSPSNTAVRNVEKNILFRHTSRSSTSATSVSAMRVSTKRGHSGKYGTPYI